MTPEGESLRTRETQRVARVSVAAAVVITTAKLGVGWTTGSLGLIADGAHSALDLVASLVTLYALRVANQPPDEQHRYGHGKAEHLAAVFEAALLMVTAGWILYESGRRLLIDPVDVRPTSWAFLVIVGSIAVDYWRSRMLTAAADKHRSHALEADALNFRTDMWSSGAVLLGLALVTAGQRWAGLGGLRQADAWASVVVALFIVYASYRLGNGAVHALLDRAPEGLAAEIRETATSVPHVLKSGPVRVREAGDSVFVDLVVTVDRTTSLARAHHVADEVEQAIRTVDAESDVVVHVEPEAAAGETMADTVRSIAQRQGLRTHHERLHRTDSGYDTSLHLELDPHASLQEAWERANRLDRLIRRRIEDMEAVDIHIEPKRPQVEVRREITERNHDKVAAIRDLVKEIPEVTCRQVRLYRASSPTESIYDATLVCAMAPAMAVQWVHELTEQLEGSLREHVDGLRDVVIRAEPAGGGGDAPTDR